MSGSLQYITHRFDQSVSGWCNVYPIGPYGSGFVDYGCVGSRSYVESTSRKPAYRIRVKPITSWSIRCRRSCIDVYIYIGQHEQWQEISIHRRRFTTKAAAIEYIRYHRDNWSWWTRDHAEVFPNHA